MPVRYIVHTPIHNPRNKVRPPASDRRSLPSFLKLITAAIRFLLFQFVDHTDEVARANWLFNKLRDSYDRPSAKWKFSVLARSVCQDGFRALHGIKRTRFYDVRKLVLENNVQKIVHGNSLRPYPSPKFTLMSSWLMYALDVYCEIIPHLQLVILPYGLNKTDFYNVANEYLQIKWNVPADEVPAVSYFLEILRKKYPFCKTCRRIKLGRCHYCCQVRLRLQEKNIPKEERESITKDKSIHNKAVMDERKIYKKWSIDSLNPDNDIMSFILDKGNGPRIPHSSQFPKSWATTIRPKTNMFGFINHGKKLKFIIPFMENYPDDPNFVISLILSHLNDMAEKGTRLPKILHIQADNCVKENKNKWFVAFMHTLTGLGIFKTIYTEYLPPGHTHEDIDAMYQPPSDGQTKYDCMTWSSFPEFLKKCYQSHKNQPQIKSLPIIYDWKTFFDPVIIPFKGIMTVRSMKFEVVLF